jgi:hypothetical protein
VPSGVVVVDDYHNYAEVKRAVEDAADLLPPRRARAGRMHLAAHDALPSTVERYLCIPWG